MTFGNTSNSGALGACVLAAALCCIAGALSCSNGGEDVQGINTPVRYREMLTVIPAGTTATVAGSGTDGAFPGGRTVTLSPFSMAKYETTWELWEEVRVWAGAHGYRIANPGTEGHGANGTGDAGKGWTREQRQRRPVTDVTWRDVVVWCNAYSEWCGLEPVYYQEDGLTALRSSANNTPDDPSRIETEADRAVMKPDKTGFRLPLETEWEFAARGGSPEAPDWSFVYSGGNDPAGIAWHDGNAYSSGDPDYGVHPVGTTTGGAYRGANRLGLFDMSGNAAEWCWDWLNENGITPSTPPEGNGPGVFAHRVTRGGSWRNGAPFCAVTDRNYCRPFSRGTYLGFRVARTE
jgi:formylglycine-generating enzyme required for sulfatase activity